MIKRMMLILMSITVVFLSSCSSTKGSSVNVADAKQDGVVTSSGVGSGLSFARQEKGEVYTTAAPRNQIYLFKFDNSRFTQKYLPSLNAQAKYLKSHLGASIMLAGHTDSRGSREYNIALGERRANEVAQLLRLAGVSKRQIRVVSYGEERPVAFDDNESNFKLNRRVELTYEAVR